MLRTVHTLVAFFFLWAHLYAFNEWGGYLSDQGDRSKAHTPLMAGTIQRGEMFILACVCAFVSVVFYALLDVRLVPIACADITIGILYAHPRVLLKDVPFMSFVILFSVSVGDFMLGWLIFSPYITPGVLIGLYFGVLGIVGQSYHETGDYDTDKKSGIRTNAVRFGKKRIFITGFVLYTVACLYFCLLAQQAIVPDYLCIPLLVSYPLYVVLFAACVRTQLRSSAIHTFIVRYRVLYGGVGLAMLILLCIKRSLLH
jgi:4-hydroxybenzoate polyprenyltransferase